MYTNPIFINRLHDPIVIYTVRIVSIGHSLKNKNLHSHRMIGKHSRCSLCAEKSTRRREKYKNIQKSAQYLPYKAHSEATGSILTCHWTMKVNAKRPSDENARHSLSIFSRSPGVLPQNKYNENIRQYSHR